MKLGRPFRAGSKTVKVTIRATAAERAKWIRAASGKPLSVWIRARLKP